MEVLRALHEFFLNFEGLYDEFQRRAQAVQHLLHSSDCGFILIASADPCRLHEVKIFYDILKKHQLPLEGFIFNQVFPYFPTHAHILKTVLQYPVHEARDEKFSQVLGQTFDFLESFNRLAARQRTNIDLLMEELQCDKKPVLIPLFEHGIYELSDFKKIHVYFHQGVVQ